MLAKSRFVGFVPSLTSGLPIDFLTPHRFSAVHLNCLTLFQLRVFTHQLVEGFIYNGLSFTREGEWGWHGVERNPWALQEMSLSCVLICRNDKFQMTYQIQLHKDLC